MQDNFQQSFMNQMHNPEFAATKTKGHQKAWFIVLPLVVLVLIVAVVFSGKIASQKMVKSQVALNFFNYLISGEESNEKLPPYEKNQKYKIYDVIMSGDKEEAKEYIGRARVLNKIFTDSIGDGLNERAQELINKQKADIEFLDFYINNPAPTLDDVFDSLELTYKEFGQRYYDILGDKEVEDDEAGEGESRYDIPIIVEYMDKLEGIGSDYASQYAHSYLTSIQYDIYEASQKIINGCESYNCEDTIDLSEVDEEYINESYDDFLYAPSLCATSVAAMSYDIMEQLK